MYQVDVQCAPTDILQGNPNDCKPGEVFCIMAEIHEHNRQQTKSGHRRVCHFNTSMVAKMTMTTMTG